ADLVIEDVLKLPGVKVIADGNLDSLSTLSELAKTELPQTGPWVLRIKADTESLESPVIIAAQLEGEGTKTVVDGSLPDILAPQTFETQLDIDVESFARVGALFGKKIPEDKPVKITGKAWGKPGEYRIEELTVREEQSEILASLAYLHPPAADVERASIIGELTITDFDFTDYLAAKKETVESEAEQAPDADKESLEKKMDAVEKESETVGSEMGAEQDKKDQQTEEAPTTNKRIFSDKPLAVGMLREYDVDLKIDATNTRISDGTDMNGTIAVSLDDGLLRVDPLDLSQTNGGSGIGYLKLDARSQEAVLDVAMDFDNFVSPRFGGLFDLDLDLDGRGESVADMMASLNGHFAAALKDIELEKSFMSQFGAGLLSNLNPLDSDKTKLECAVVRFNIEDGIARFNKKIAAQTTEVTWLGGGKINLKTEDLDMGIAPKARGAISGLTNVGLASLVHIGGTLAEPKIGIDLADVAKKYVDYTAFFATGGLSFLAQKVVDTAQANVNQCKKILGDLQAAEDEAPIIDSDR
ncbi:MAG: AsmA family protein, partial [Desulfofustis sp.]|nr:AsmA family protein [Desulfofustis sp.]